MSQLSICLEAVASGLIDRLDSVQSISLCQSSRKDPLSRDTRIARNMGKKANIDRYERCRSPAEAQSWKVQLQQRIQIISYQLLADTRADAASKSLDQRPEVLVRSLLAALLCRYCEVCQLLAQQPMVKSGEYVQSCTF